MPVRQSTDQDAFLAIVCADAELLRAEFDAIIDACWDPPPPPTRSTRPVRPPTGPGRPTGWRQPSRARWPDRPGDHGWVRQRSPPRGSCERGTPPTRNVEKGR